MADHVYARQTVYFTFSISGLESRIDVNEWPYISIHSMLLYAIWTAEVIEAHETPFSSYTKLFSVMQIIDGSDC